MEAKLQVMVPQMVEKAPTLTPLEDIVCEEGDGLHITTTVGGHPAPKVQWYREGAIIPQSRDFEVSTICIVRSY